MDRFVDVLLEEIRLMGERHKGQVLETLYLGGGTPSLLSPAQLEKILNTIHCYHSFQDDSEWTMECNPDDLNVAAIRNFQKAGFNRLSIGVQSFHERDLELMRRSHNADQAVSSVRHAASGGFDNITIDLIYGIPGQETADWEKNIEHALSLPITHLSAYHLTFEQGTVFDHWRKKGKLIPEPEEKSIEQYRTLKQLLLDGGFDHYELSNFGRGGIVSRHNMLYWSGQPYLGFGPSAHSYDGEQRSWNISSLKKYMEGIESGKEIGETEQLKLKDRYHDYLITSLRTRWGADPLYMEEKFGKQTRELFENKSEAFINSGSMYYVSGRLAIEPGQWLITDHILRELFMD